MAWRRPGAKPLSEPMMVKLSTHICVTRPQWDKLRWQQRHKPCSELFTLLVRNLPVISCINIIMIYQWLYRPVHWYGLYKIVIFVTEQFQACFRIIRVKYGSTCGLTVGLHNVGIVKILIKHTKYYPCHKNGFKLPFNLVMMTSSNGSIFHVTGPLCGDFTRHRWIPRTKASDMEPWCFMWSTPEQTVEQTVETPVIWDTITLIMTSL